MGKNWIERQGTEVQNKDNMGGVFKFICEVYFFLKYICYKVTAPLYFLNFHLNTKFYFYHFSVYNRWDEREIKGGIWLREKKCHFCDSGHQKISFLFQMVPYDERNLTWVFFFTLKVPKKHLKKLSSWNFVKN